MPQYDRRHWRHWIDANRICRNTRHEVLVDESLIVPTFKTAELCQVLSGEWLAPYSATEVTESTKLDIDHMVPLGNAHRSGGWNWDADRKREYANNLDDNYHLIAVTASANRSKGAKGPEEWQPPDQTYRCQYATDWVLIKSIGQRGGVDGPGRDARHLRSTAGGRATERVPAGRCSYP